MCSDTSSYLESIQDFILNQDKIVTYRWLSKKLNIHTNTSKQLLYSFAKKESEEKLLVSYLVSGSSKDGLKVVVVPEQDLEKVKSSLDSVLSQHVYSVQKSTSCFSSSHLYLADSSASSSTNKLSSISPREVEERQMKVCSVPKPSVPTSTAKTSTAKSQEKVTFAAVSKKPSLFNGKASEKNKKETTEPAIEKETKETPPVSESPVKKLAVSPIKNKSVVVSPTKSHKKKAAQVRGGGIQALFSKQAEKKKTEPIPKEEKKTQEIQQTTAPEETVEDDHMDVDEEIPEAVLKNNSPVKTVNKTPIGNRKKQTKVGNKKRKSDKAADNTPARKRKRIVVASDSESEENEEEDDYVEEEPESPEHHPPETIESDDDEVIPPTPLGEKIKPRIRKQIDKTFIDDDGYVITKKEYVYVSVSEDEDKDGEDKIKPIPQEKEKPEKTTAQVVSKENETKPNGNEEQSHNETKSKGKSNKKTAKEKNKSPKKTSPTSIRNQTSIMNFFKKK